MILLTGSTGFLGQAVVRQLDAQAVEYWPLPGREAGNDFRVPGTFDQFLQTFHPTTVIHLAYPGANGIGTSVDTPADLTRDTLQIDLTVIDACARMGVKTLITMGSVCSYPEQVTYPTDETQLWAGAPEPVNAPYGHAKRMQLALLEAYHRQYGLAYTQLILGNLYGPGDRSGHVIPATIRKVIQAQYEGRDEIVIWGDGTASREFLYVEDAAQAIVRAATTPALNRAINICSGQEILIRDLVHHVSAALNYWGAFTWDATKPNGQQRRWFDNARAAALLHWHPQTPFPEGLQRTVAWIQDAARAER